uniref:DUF4283 domain-containing protein n=1 Tax=Setaria viridis TaxID=4556 RepID=A0A4U6WDZ8_SETVI|nr:hypothetical protein SEVIR_2G417500v2 [Setaria viridis]
MAVAKLLMVKHFSKQSLISTMHSAWNTAREVTFRPIVNNLLAVQASCLGDRKRIMEEGSWLFRRCVLMLEEYDGSTDTPMVLPSKVQAWIQIHGIAPLYHTERIVKQLAAKVEKVIGVEMRVKYEKVAHLCAHCGMMGHGHLECGKGEHKEEDLQYGEWMVAVEDTWCPRTPCVRGNPVPKKGRHARHGGMRATGVWKEKYKQVFEGSGSCKRMPEEADL